MRLSMLRSALLAVSLIGAAAPVIAADPPPPVVGNASFSSQYRYRGISQSDNRPAVAAGLDYAHASGLYVGTWASSISWLNDAGVGGSSIEWDLYGGYKGAAGPIAYDVGGLLYYYPGRFENGATKANTFELYGAGTWEWITLKASYSLTNTFGFTDSKGSAYFDATATYPVMEGFNLIGHVGYQLIKASTEVNRTRKDCSYVDYKVGATYDYVGVTWGAAVIGTNSKDICYTNYRGMNQGKTTLVISATKTF